MIFLNSEVEKQFSCSSSFRLGGGNFIAPYRSRASVYSGAAELSVFPIIATVSGESLKVTLILPSGFLSASGRRRRSEIFTMMA